MKLPRITITVTQNDKADIEAAAHQRGLSVAAYCRLAILSNASGGVAKMTCDGSTVFACGADGRVLMRSTDTSITSPNVPLGLDSGEDDQSVACSRKQFVGAILPRGFAATGQAKEAARKRWRKKPAGRAKGST